MSDSFMTIREMCDAYGVTPRTLRFYEAKELIFPQRQGTKRLFTRSDRARLKLILRGKRFGCSLEDIRQILDLYDPATQNVEQLERAIELGQNRLAEMEAQRDELNVAIEELREQLDWGSKSVETLRTTSAHAA